MVIIKITYTDLFSNPQVSIPFSRYGGMDDRIVIILILKKYGCKCMD
jgi:hypothetical protein